MPAFRRGSLDEEKSANFDHLHDEFSAARKKRSCKRGLSGFGTDLFPSVLRTLRLDRRAKVVVRVVETFIRVAAIWTNVSQIRQTHSNHPSNAITGWTETYRFRHTPITSHLSFVHYEDGSKAIQLDWDSFRQLIFYNGNLWCLFYEFIEIFLITSHRKHQSWRYFWFPCNH